MIRRLLLFQRCTYRVEKRDSAGALFRRVMDAYRESGVDPSPVLFHLMDRPDYRKQIERYGHRASKTVSAVARILKRIPSLEAFACIAEDAHGSDVPLRVLSNCDVRFEEGRDAAGLPPVDVETLARIAEGIPK